LQVLSSRDIDDAAREPPAHLAHEIERAARRLGARWRPR
jgi:hypothetical protein